MAGLKGNLSTIAKLKSNMRALPVTLAQSVAARGAPMMTALTRDAYSSGQNVYGDARPAGKDGATLTLHKTGTVERELRFVSIGTIIRCALGPKYSKFLIGKYGILPNGGMPTKWRAALDVIVQETKASL